MVMPEPMANLLMECICVLCKIQERASALSFLLLNLKLANLEDKLIYTVQPDDVYTHKNLTSGFYIFTIFGTNNMNGVIVVRVASNGDVAYSTPPSGVTVSAGSNYIKFSNNSSSNSLTIFKRQLS